METLRDLLVFYNNMDVVPFLAAIAKQKAFYKERGIDMLKAGMNFLNVIFFGVSLVSN